MPVYAVVEMEREHMLDVLLFILQQVEESTTFRAWNLTLLEITYYILSSHTPAALFERESSQRSSTEAHANSSKDRDGQESGDGAGRRGAASHASEQESNAPVTPPPPAAPKPIGALRGMLLDRKAGRDSLLTQQSARHGRFGGAFRVRSDFGTEHVLGQLNSSVTLAGAP